MAYQPTLPASESIEELKSWMYEELLRISSDLDLLEKVELNSEPEKPFHMQMVLADGTDWNPGSGRGFYWYDISDESWNFIS